MNEPHIRDVKLSSQLAGRKRQRASEKRAIAPVVRKIRRKVASIEPSPKPNTPKDSDLIVAAAVRLVASRDEENPLVTTDNFRNSLREIVEIAARNGMKATQS